MTRLLLSLLPLFLLFTVTDLDAGKSSRYPTPRLFTDREAERYSSKYSSRYSTRSSKTYCYSCQREKSGRIARSSTGQTGFRKANPCPSTGKTTGPCTGYVIDHRVLQSVVEGITRQTCSGRRVKPHGLRIGWSE
jgi:hypothetical protein